MYRIDRNNFHINTKENDIETPTDLSEFIYFIVSPIINNKDEYILDPCVGKGSLLNPFIQNGYKTIGIDNIDLGFKDTVIENYLDINESFVLNPSLVICNPPFNVGKDTKKKHSKGRPLIPELFLKKTIELFGKDIPMILFTPYGFRLNQKGGGKRREKFINGEYPPIKSIISLPLDIFKGITFHSEILIFNIDGLKPHYFYGEKYV